MTTTPFSPVDPPEAPVPSGRPVTRRRWRTRRTVAVIAAGGLLAGVVGLSSTVTSGSATTSTSSTTDWMNGRGSSTQTWSGGSDPWSQGGSSDGSSGSSSGTSGTQSSTVDSTTATTAQEKGVALIDTVLSNGEAAGTGIVLTSDGEVLTNYHVVEDSTSIRVTIASTGKAYTATVVGSDESADIALLQLKDASGLTVSKIDDDTVRLGDDVTAVGNAGGTGTLTAAEGTVTDLSSSITTASEGTVAGETLKKLIETDADVVPGDSGGPLVDAEGEVVGIDTAASSGQEIDGYAIPIATALTVVTQIRTGAETSTVQIGARAFLGIELGASTGSDGSTSTSGADVYGVESGDAADDAGLAAGDTITKLGTSKITDADDLTTALSKLDPGDKIKITWTTTSGRSESATVTLGASPLN